MTSRDFPRSTGDPTNGALANVCPGAPVIASRNASPTFLSPVPTQERFNNGLTSSHPIVAAYRLQQKPRVLPAQQHSKHIRNSTTKTATIRPAV
jgi:hypothetical protein